LPGIASQEDRFPLGPDGLFHGLLLSAARGCRVVSRAVQGEAVGAGECRARIRLLAIHRRLGHRLDLRTQGRSVRCDGGRDQPASDEAGELTMTINKRIAVPLVGVACALASDFAFAQAVPEKFRYLTFLVSAAIIAVTMYVTFLAAKRIRTSADFYAAGSSVSGLQNGWAIAGDYLSAASFLGIAGLISLYGYDGFMYSVGWLVAYI